MPTFVANVAAMSYLSDGYDISCRSLQLNKTIPRLSEIARNIPDFEAEETCHVQERGTYIVSVLKCIFINTRKDHL